MSHFALRKCCRVSIILANAGIQFVGDVQRTTHSA